MIEQRITGPKKKLIDRVNNMAMAQKMVLERTSNRFTELQTEI